jgi:hypothetical protein
MALKNTVAALTQLRIEDELQARRLGNRRLPLGDEPFFLLVRGNDAGVGSGDTRVELLVAPQRSLQVRLALGVRSQRRRRPSWAKSERSGAWPRPTASATAVRTSMCATVRARASVKALRGKARATSRVRAVTVALCGAAAKQARPPTRQPAASTHVGEEASTVATSAAVPLKMT